MKNKLLDSKAKNLQLLKKLGFNVPKFIVLSNTTYESFPKMDLFEYVVSSFKSMYRRVPTVISVRSSGSVSTPGRMKTILNVELTLDRLKESFEKVRASYLSKRLALFLELLQIKDFKCSYIFQEMITPTSEMDCTGVLISCNPYSKESDFYAEFLLGNVGSDLMDGKITPISYTQFKEVNPNVAVKLNDLVQKLRETFEGEFELEFVVKDSEIFLLQIRKYKLNTNSLKLNSTFSGKGIGQGNSIVQRGFSGVVTYDVQKADSSNILVIEQTDYEDVAHMVKFGGIITLKGGRLSHAAIIANQFDLNCVVGTQFEQSPKEGDFIKINEKGTIFL